MINEILHFYFKFSKFKFHCHIWIKYEDCIQMSTNKPSIGPVVLEIALWILRNLTNFMFSMLKHQRGNMKMSEPRQPISRARQAIRWTCDNIRSLLSLGKIIMVKSGCVFCINNTLRHAVYVYCQVSKSVRLFNYLRTLWIYLFNLKCNLILSSYLGTDCPLN